MSRRPALLIISQVYVPDPASVGQHMRDIAVEMVRRGQRVVVYTSDRGYEDPSRRYPRRELLEGVEVRRLPLSSFGKRRLAFRLLGALLFLAQAALRGLFTRNLAGVLVSTSPAMGASAGLLIRAVRRVPLTYWAMDINPDQLVAMGGADRRSLGVRLMDTLNRGVLRRAESVVCLDPFMAERLERKVEVGPRLHVIPPWPHEDELAPVDHGSNPFRREHGLEGRFVVMYSGNISPAHPVSTVLEAARRLRGDPELLFLFIGDGLEARKVEEAIERHQLTNVRRLPHQPLERLRYSLSAADLHLVVMGPEMVGIVHPCKVYGAMAVARPILYLGPQRSHVGQIVERHRVGWQVAHGDVEATVASLRAARRAGRAALEEMGARGRTAVRRRLGKRLLCGQLGDLLELGAAGAVPSVRRGRAAPVVAGIRAASLARH